MDRTVELINMSAPDGTPITFQGNEVGQVIQETEKGCLCRIDSNIVLSWIKGDRCGYSVEVIRK